MVAWMVLLLLRKGVVRGEEKVFIEGEDDDFGLNLKGIK